MLFVEDSTSTSSKSRRSSASNHLRPVIKNAPRVPSNLVREPPSSSSSSSSTLSNLKVDSTSSVCDRQELVAVVGEREDYLLSVCDEYEQQFETYLSANKRFQMQKLNNLKLAFKNQMLKQQIYFETEIFELAKETTRDFQQFHANRKKSSKSNRKLSEKEKEMIKLFSSDLKTLVQYMRESLLNSCDSLIEAYETCQVLKKLEQLENNMKKQKATLKSSTQALMQRDTSSGESSNNDEEVTKQQKQLNEDEEQFAAYKKEMDELMHILDDIELQHLQRKDVIFSKAKFVGKLKTKFKFIENKFEALSRQTRNLKYESNLFRQLYEECEKEKQYGSSSYDETASTSFSPSNSSRSSSTSSLVDCSDMVLLISPSQSSSSSSAVADLEKTNQSFDIEEEDEEQDVDPETNPGEEEREDEGNQVGARSSSSSSSSASQISDFSDLLLDQQASSSLNYEDLDKTSSEAYSRKLGLVNDLINLHKAKLLAKPIWELAASSSSNSTSGAASNLNKSKQLLAFSSSDEASNRRHMIFNDSDDHPTLALPSILSSNRRLKLTSNALELNECSLDGNEVVIENSNLRLDSDISSWTLTRQIDNLAVTKYEIPPQSVIKSGKALTVQKPFESGDLQMLYAIQLSNNNRSVQAEPSNGKTTKLQVKTKLIAPDGQVMCLHVQDVPDFYNEVYKYASLIKFL